MKKCNIAFYRLVMIVALCVIMMGVFDGAQANGNFQIQPTMVSKNVSGTGAGNGSSHARAISADGNRIIFQSRATNLTSIPVTEDRDHLYVYDHGLGTVTLIDKNASGTGSTTGYLQDYTFSQDGSSVVLN